MIYEGPFLIMLVRRFVFFISEANQDWIEYSRSRVLKDFNEIMMIPRYLYVSQGIVLPVICLTEPSVSRHLIQSFKIIKARIMGQKPKIYTKGILSENQYDNLKNHPSTVFLTSHLNNYLACAVSNSIKEGMKRDIQLGTEVPENPQL